MRHLTASIAVLLLAGCAGPRPQVPVAARFASPAVWRSASDGSGAIGEGWWTTFGDRELTRVVETALAKNLDVAAAATRIEEARGQFKLAAAQRLPIINGSVAGGRQQDVSPFGLPQAHNDMKAEVSGTLDPDLFGGLASSTDAARALILASEAGRADVQLAIAAGAAIGYINLRALDARLGVLLSTLDARFKSLAFAQRRFQAGYTSALDLRQAEGEYQATQQLIPQTVAAIAHQENGLRVLLGQNPGAIPRGIGLNSLVPPPIPAGLPSSLLRRRPDLIEAEQQLVSADKTLDAARAAFLPKVQLTAGGGYVASTLLANPIQLFSLGGSVLAPIFDSGRLRAVQSVVASQRDRAALAYRQAAIQAFREVDDALADERQDTAQLAALSTDRAALAGALQIATSRYRAGYAPYLDQLDAQRNLLAVDLTVLQVRGSQLTAAVALFRALGGGWRNLG